MNTKTILLQGGTFAISVLIGWGVTASIKGCSSSSEKLAQGTEEPYTGDNHPSEVVPDTTIENPDQGKIISKGTNDEEAAKEAELKKAKKEAERKAKEEAIKKAEEANKPTMSNAEISAILNDINDGTYGVSKGIPRGVALNCTNLQEEETNPSSVWHIRNNIKGRSWTSVTVTGATFKKGVVVSITYRANHRE